MDGEFPCCAVSDLFAGDLVTNGSGLGNLRVTNLSLEQGPCRRTTSNPNCKRASEEEAHGGGDEPSACVRCVPSRIKGSLNTCKAKGLSDNVSQTVFWVRTIGISRTAQNSGYKTGLARAKGRRHPHAPQPRPPYQKSQSSGGVAPTIGHNQPIGTINYSQAGK